MFVQMPTCSCWLPALAVVLASPAAAQTGLPAPVPPPIEQTGADCARPQYASDRLVCEDTQLRAMDADVAALAQALPGQANGSQWEDQAAWFRRRSRCAFEADHRACLSAAYADRRAVLIAATAPANRPLRCDGTWRSLALLASAGSAIAIRTDGRLLTVATPPATAWQPWVALRQSGRRIKLRPMKGPVIRCRPG